MHHLKGLGEWRVNSTLRLTRQSDRWLVDWHPSALHPDAGPGDRFARERRRPPRAPIIGAGGQPITAITKVVAVGVQPSRIKDQPAVAAALQQHLAIDPARLDTALKARGVKPDHFVGMVELREERFRQVEAALRPVPGIVFQRKDARLTPAEGFAAHTVGRTGEAQPASPVPAALVAVDAATGQIVAVSSRPLSEPLNRALSGRYPPGSTFKIVTTDALIAEAGGKADQRLSCPAEVKVGGKRFKNFEGEALGDDISLRDAFVHSCNTAFAPAGERLGTDALVAAAARYGFGVDYKVGLGRATGGSFPPPKDAAEQAAAAIGQGRVLATPAHMASVVAAATTGTWHAPHLLAGATATATGAATPPTAAPTPPTAAPTPPTAAPTPPTAAPTPPAIDPLRDFLRGVVTEGTAKAAARVPDLRGKTGTAEFGTGTPLPTHAWFVGERNGIAFALILEGGGVGGRDAAPIAATFAGAL